MQGGKEWARRAALDGCIQLALRQSPAVRLFRHDRVALAQQIVAIVGVIVDAGIGRTALLAGTVTDLDQRPNAILNQTRQRLRLERRHAKFGQWLQLVTNHRHERFL